MDNKLVTAVIVGAGHRALAYGEYSFKHPDRLKIVGVADIDPFRRKTVMEKFGFSQEYCFESAEELAKVPRFADAIINGTMDEQHVDTAIPLLERGYDMLLEKPFAVNDEEAERLLEVVKRNNNKVMICHVLRYTPFYNTIKQIVLSGEIGDILNIQTVENVSYDHLSTSYVRGKWGNSDRCHTTMLLAKCSHDTDLIAWYMENDKPVAVSSFGSQFQFKKENAPEGAGTRCLVDCPHVDSCRYSAKKLYLDDPEKWAFYVWQNMEHVENPTREQYEAELKRSNFGKCIYNCGCNVVDHQSVLINFESGATATHNMVGGSPASLRTIRITGTKGEIYGEFENKFINVKTLNPQHGKYFDERTIDLSHISGEGHGGGDDGITADFCAYQKGDNSSIACTSVFGSAVGHRIVFLADKSRENGGQVQKY